MKAEELQKPEVRLYRFYNWEKSRHGEPFALCDRHVKQQPVPGSCVLVKLADKALLGCIVCAEGARGKC